MADVFVIVEPPLAKLHNTRAFMQAIYVNASASEKAEMKPLESAALSVMRNLP